MDEVALLNLLNTTGLPVAYHHFVTPPAPPYIVYLFSYSSNFGADNKYIMVRKTSRELYKLEGPQ